MIPRYSRPEMAAIWSAENRYRIWFEIEALACEAMADAGQIPADAARAIRDRGGARIAAISAADVERIDAIERETRHDVIAFLTWLGEGIGPEARYVHQGMTSSDVLDTCLSVQLVQAADLLISDTEALLAVLKKRAFEHKYTLTIGRSHGIHAEPTSFGLKLAGHHAEFARNLERLRVARQEVASCAISGAIGTFAHLDPAIEARVAARLGLRPEPVSTQVIPRDRHAAFFCALGLVASGIERLATEVRHLQRSEMREAEEFFHPGQKGSSAMPHKRNPVLSENLTGLARIVRAAVVPALENVTLWHERDISHSSVERVFAPDATIALDFALGRLAGMMEKLVVYPERMAANLRALGGVVHSQEVLLALTQAGMSREDAYKAVQRNAMAVWGSLGEGPAASGDLFRARLAADPEVSALLSMAALRDLFDPRRHLRHLDTLFLRVFGEKGPAAPAGWNDPLPAPSISVAMKPAPEVAPGAAAVKQEPASRPSTFAPKESPFAGPAIGVGITTSPPPATPHGAAPPAAPAPAGADGQTDAEKKEAEKKEQRPSTFAPKESPFGGPAIGIGFGTAPAERKPKG